MALTDKILSSRNFLQFGGQGSPYLKEMTDLYNKNPELKKFFETAFTALEQEMARERVKNSMALPQGLQIREWVTNTEKAPDESYLSAASVSIPLIGVAQLANFFLFVEKGKISGDALMKITAGVTGHSQGLIPAVFVGLGYDGQDLYDHAGQYIKYLLYLGICSQEAYGPLELDTRAKQKLQEMGEKDITPMVANVGPTAAELQAMIDQLNPDLSDNDKLYLSLSNTPNSCVISARPISLLKFREKFKDEYDSKKWKFVPIKTTAAFHSPLMNASEELMVKEIDRMNFSYQGSQLKVPVYSIHDGRNLQQDSELAMVMFREMVLQVLHWDKATKTLREDTSIENVIDFGPSKVSSRLTGGHLTNMDKAPDILCLSNPKDLNAIFA